MMKRWGIVSLVAAIFLAIPTSASATVITPSGHGRPTLAQSNPGTVSGPSHRSATASRVQAGRDRSVYIWDF